MIIIVYFQTAVLLSNTCVTVITHQLSLTTFRKQKNKVK